MSTISNINKQISVWRGSETPPTNYHIWILEDNTIWYYKDKWTLLTANDAKFDEIMEGLNELRKSLGNYYTKLEADSKFLTEESDPTVPDWAKQSTKPTYSALEVHALPDTTKIPSKTSDLKNDSNFVTVDDIPTKVSQLRNDTGYITKNGVPTKLSAFTNDTHFVTESDLPTALSDLKNDVGYITKVDIPTEVSAFNNDAGYITNADIPTRLSLLENDTSYITVDDVPKNLSEYTNDADFITKTEVDEAIKGIDGYSREYIDETFATKVEVGALQNNLTDYIDEADKAIKESIELKASINSPAFTGVPTVPTPGEDASDNLIPNIGWVEEYVGDTVNKAVNVTTDLEDGTASINIAGKNIQITGGKGIEVQLSDDTKSFVIENTSVLEDHASEDTKYGVGTDTLYGHVKLLHEFDRSSGVIIAPDETEGVAASPALVYSALLTALAATKLEIEFSSLDVQVLGVPTISYDPSSETNTTINFTGANGIGVSVNENGDIVISAEESLTLDNIHAGTNVEIKPYSDGGISINSNQREVYAYEIDESGNTSDEQKKVLTKDDLEDLKFGPSLMSLNRVIDIAWSEILKNHLTHKI